EVSPLIRTATYNILKKNKKIILPANLRITACKGFAVLNSILTSVGKSQMKTMCNVDGLWCDRLGSLSQAMSRYAEIYLLYLADTKNHLIRTLELDKRVLRTLTLNK
ncbi:MAG: hypothetical protein QOK81_04650, partial [Nitrososphaeraceae archaeon]|nr:hypothetical protein [Nitrososphaeraceae archaeon]